MTRTRITLTAEQKELAVSLYTSGELSSRAIAARFGVSPNNIRSAIISAGHTLDKKLHFIAASAVGRESPMKGRAKSAESIAKQIATRKRNNIPRRKGYKHSQETLAKISAATKGKNVKYTPEEKKLRERIRQSCKRFLRRVLEASGKRKTTPTQQALGYTTAELSLHLGPISQGDHIDHIVPIVEFFRRGIFDPSVINALPNLRVLDGVANRMKSDFVPKNADEIISRCFASVTYTQGIS